MTDIMIEARNLTKHYGDVQALKGISFEVRRGEVLGFLGPNGAGKTTTMKILTCFIAPTEGTAQVNGCDIFEDSLGARAALGYLPENTPLYTEMMVEEYLAFIAKMRGLSPDRAIAKTVEQTGLGDVRRKEIRALSKGFRQRVGLAQALIHEPPILVLDEPLSGLDPNQASEIRDLIKEIGRERTVILSTHNLAEVQLSCNRVLIVSKGELVADDTPENLRNQAGDTFLRISFKLSAGQSADEISGQLSKVRGVARVELDGEDGAEIAFRVFSAADTDVRAKIFQAAVEGGFTLVGVEEQAQDLNEVFLHLTTTEEERAATDARVQARADARGDSDDDADGEADDEAEAEGAAPEPAVAARVGPSAPVEPEAPPDDDDDGDPVDDEGDDSDKDEA